LLSDFDQVAEAVRLDACEGQVQGGVGPDDLSHLCDQAAAMRAQAGIHEERLAIVGEQPPPTSVAVEPAAPKEAAWLETLVWPEQTARLARLRAAMRLAAAARPRLVRGDLRRDLAALAADAPAGVTRVIFHTAVLAYIASVEERREFARSVRLLCDFWIANEAPRTLPEIDARAGAPPRGRFLLSVNGEPVGWTDPHGAALDWIAATGYEPPTTATGDGLR